MNEAYLYPYSAEYARQRGEESLWRASYLSNMDCKDAIRKAVWQHYDGAHLDGDCLAKVIQEFGYKRTAWVLDVYKRQGLLYPGNPARPLHPAAVGWM